VATHVARHLFAASQALEVAHARFALHKLVSAPMHCWHAAAAAAGTGAPADPPHFSPHSLPHDVAMHALSAETAAAVLGCASWQLVWHVGSALLHAPRQDA
jgi:hypothetical protein